MRDATGACRCGKPTRDTAYFCDGCGDDLSRALGDVPWLAEELDVTIGRQKGVNYDGTAIRGAETPSPVHWGASEARVHLRALLVSWVLFCRDEGVRNASPHVDLPADTMEAMSGWLLWRVDGLALDPIGPEAVDEITDAVAKCHRLIDRAPDRQYLGHCQECSEGGSLYGMPGASIATCDVCDAKVDAESIRGRLLKELDDRLCTAAEIARLSTYLGLHADREQVRKRINTWHKRKRIESESMFDEPAFRFGIVWRLLQQEDSVRDTVA